MGLRADLDRCEKFRPPPGFDPRTVQPVASRYTDNAIVAPFFGEVRNEILYVSSNEFHRSKG